MLCILYVNAVGALLGMVGLSIERLLPRPSREVSVVVPYSRGDLVARAHRQGEVLKVEHTGDGTELCARVPASLAAELGRFVVAADPA